MSPDFTLAFVGDVVGEPGRRAFAHAARVLRERHAADLVVVNAENAKHGSGLSAEGFRALRAAGADALTLGDHVYRERQAVPLLEDPASPVLRPANLASAAPGKKIVLVPPPRPGLPPLAVVTVLGRLYMPIPADDPFAAVDREMAALEASHPGAVALVEVHAEATSEKQALAWHCLRRWPGLVVAVVGTHTHVQTADARILEHRLAAITDVGMCGPHRSVLGRRVEDVLLAMTTQSPTTLDVADGENRACGVLVRIDPAARRALSIEPFALNCPD